MKTTLLIILCVIGKLSFSQTVIKLKHKSGPKHDYQYVNPKDTAFVFVYRNEDMGQWTNPAYTIKVTVPDGKYSVYINDVLDQEVFIKNHLPDSTWILYYPDGNLRQSISYKDGKLHGKYINFFYSGSIGSISAFSEGVMEYSVSYYESGYTAARMVKKGKEMVTEQYDDSALFRTAEFDKAKNTFYILNPKTGGSATEEIAMKIPYELDPYTLVIGITKQAKQHPEQLKKFLKKNKLTMNGDDYLSVYKPVSRYLNSYAIRVSKKNKAAFSKTECKELKTLREKQNLIRQAGPRISFLSDSIFSSEFRPERYALFTTRIDVLIDAKDEDAFFKLIEKEKLYHVYKPTTSENKLYYRLIYNDDVGAGINEIAARLLGNKIIVMTYPIVEQIQAKNSHMARF